MQFSTLLLIEGTKLWQRSLIQSLKMVDNQILIELLYGVIISLIFIFYKFKRIRNINTRSTSFENSFNTNNITNFGSRKNYFISKIMLKNNSEKIKELKNIL